jgi:threonine dehydratase
MNQSVPSPPNDSVCFDEVRSAAIRIAPYCHRTPVMTCSEIDQRVRARVFFKCENLQKTGAFKFRGATNAIAQLSPEELSRGVVTHSSGNHAAALASAARIFGATAYIVMPSNSSAIKKAAVVHYGGQITECEPTLAARLEVANRVQQETGAVMIPPFDHPHIIAGQATCAREFLHQVPELDAIIAPVGGGGLMSGTCVSARAMKPGMLVLGAEPAGADDAFRSKQLGKFVPQLDPQTISDGLRTSLGELTWPYVRDQVDEIITADDEGTIEAMRFFWERTKLVIEPSSAVPLAAIFKRFSDTAPPENIGVIISGGNVDLLDLPWTCRRCV